MFCCMDHYSQTEILESCPFSRNKDNSPSDITHMIYSIRV